MMTTASRFYRRVAILAACAVLAALASARVPTAAQSPSAQLPGEASEFYDSHFHLRRDVRVVVRLRGGAATARHLAVARAELTRERRRMKEHAWKLIPLARADAHRQASTQLPSTTSRNNDMRLSVPVSDSV